MQVLHYFSKYIKIKGHVTHIGIVVGLNPDLLDEQQIEIIVINESEV